MNAAEYFDHWDKVWRDLLRGVSVFREQDLTFQPSPHYPRSVGDILRHIINLEEGWIHYVIQRKLDHWPPENPGNLDSLPSLRSKMEQVHSQTEKFLSSINIDDFNRIVSVPGDGTPKLGWILWHVLEQEIHHRGELFLCLSILGHARPDIDRPE